MPKQKKQPNLNLSLEQFLSTYDYKTLHGSVVALQNSIAWDVLRAYLKARQREFEVAALDLIRNNTMTHAAAHASGYAQCAEDVADKMIRELQDLILGKTQTVENPRPEEQVEEVLRRG